MKPIWHTQVIGRSMLVRCRNGRVVKDKLKYLIACASRTETSEKKKEFIGNRNNGKIHIRLYLTARNDTGIPPGP